ncbi:hypothetical protein [Massilia niastensis]|uniref:hypothetical protein n=1 Tax=Massilia niastensis TaxID=544911 RepID=UPI00037548F1|nr:hypothetical protein [Massilia niastensis]
MSNSSLLVGAVLLGACAVASAQTLSPDGYGDIRFGDRLDTAERRLVQRAAPPPVDPACSMVRFKKYPNVRFMVEEGRITRADASSIVRNSAGITSAMSVEQALRQQKSLRVEKHKYDENGQYLILEKGKQKALIFEAKNGKLTRMRAGVKPAVEYVETCG